MSVNESIQEGAQAIDGPATGIVAHFGTCLGGTAADNEIDTWDPGSDAQVPNVLGYGEVVEMIERKIRNTGVRQLSVKVHGSIAGTVSSVTHVGTGPTVTAAAAPGGVTGTLPALRAKVSTAGANGVAKVQIAYDGSTYQGALDVPALLPATIVGTVDLSLITPSSVNTDTVLLTPDGGSLKTTTFSAVVTLADIISQINTALGAAGVASLIGGRFLKITAVTLGSTGALIVGAGTANTLLGLTAGTLAGTNSTITIPKIGVVLTFPSGNYNALETYTVATAAPRMAISDFNTAADALRAIGYPFEGIEICQDPIDGSDTKAWADALDAKVSSWENAAENRIFPWWHMGSSLGTAGSPAANDTDVRTSMVGDTSTRGIVAHGDCYATGSEFPGSHRRSVRVPLGDILSAQRASQDPGFGGLSSAAAFPQASATSPDKTTQARDEALATIKMADAGFTVMVVQKQTPKIKKGLTRAQSTSKLLFPGVMRASRLAATTAYQRLLTYENADFLLKNDGTISDDIADGIESMFNADFRQFITDPGHASKVVSKVDRTKVADAQGKYPLTITWSLLVKGQARDVTGTLSLVTTLAIAA